MIFVEHAHMRGYLCATTITTIHYLIAKQLGNQTAVLAVRNLMSIFELASVTRSVVEQALETGFGDFEDAVLYQSGREAGVDLIVSRNPRDFRSAALPVYSPPELLALIEIDDNGR